MLLSSLGRRRSNFFPKGTPANEVGILARNLVLDPPLLGASYRPTEPQQCLHFDFQCIHILFARLHYEALKQAAFDPRDGTINMDILGTGMSDTARKQQKECADAIKKYVDSNKGKQATFKYNALMEEFRHQSDIVSNDDFVFKPFRSNAGAQFKRIKNWVESHTLGLIREVYSHNWFFKNYYDSSQFGSNKRFPFVIKSEIRPSSF